jgi:site-specific recombinase XerC
MTISDLHPNQVRALYDASARTREHARDRAILSLCLDAGLRRDEVPVLRARDVDLRTDVLATGTGACRRRVRLGTAALEAVAPFVREGRPTEPLLVSRAGTPVTDRTVHEQLRRMGELAGLGEWVTCRHTRRAYVAAMAVRHSASIALRLRGHAGFRTRPETVEEAQKAQFRQPWVSPLDELLARAGRRQAA